MYESPRMRRLRNDLAALERLRSESSVFRFTTQGDPPQQYRILFQGRGLWRDHGKVKSLERHHVEVKLGSSYPRTMPEIRWLTPIYHPNISEIGMVCLGGYGTHWVPSIQLDELCIMLWDMLRYHNYDIRSPYNRDAALWVANQTAILFPTDSRPLRDLRAALGRVAESSAGKAAASSSGEAKGRTKAPSSQAAPQATKPVERVRKFVERYGRVFGSSEEPSARRRREEPEEILSTMLPSNPELQALVTAEAATTPARGDVGRQDEVLLVETTTALPPDPPPPVTRPPSDEIIFIE
jgi:ubiquitin-protein ligase